MAVGTRTKERNNKEQAPATPPTEKPVTIDPNDPATITANNGSGPVISDAEKTLLDGLGLTGKIDLAAPITRRPIPTRGRASKLAQDERVQRIMRGLESDLDAARVAFEGDTEHYQGFAFIGTNREYNSTKGVLGTWAKGQAFTLDDGTEVTVSVAWDKHPSSPNAASTKAEDAGKPVIYIASLALAEEESDESGDEDSDDDETGDE